MKNETKLKLISLIEPQVIASLIARGYVEQINKDLTWDSIILTDYTEALLLKMEDSSTEFLKQYRELFPIQWRDPLPVLEKRYKSWRKKTQYNISEDEILFLTSDYINNTDSRFIGTSAYFLFKYDKGVYLSRLEKKYEEYLEYVKQIQHSNDERMMKPDRS